MLIKYNNSTNQFEPYKTKAYSNSLDDYSQSVLQNQIYVDDFEELVDTKVSKQGDIIDGFLNFNKGFGISGKSKTISSQDGTKIFNSTISYNTDSQNNCFVVKNTRKVLLVDQNFNLQEDGAQQLENTFNLDIDNTPTEGSNNLVTSDAIYRYIQSLGYESTIQNMEDQIETLHYTVEDLENRLTALESQ